ncbi:ABC transporter permease [Oceanobacillus profundus]|uniref:ABC transporter permease n=1 Tax=Oceanobacillus profundus TaxID=372463 RepID=UPI0036299CA4
MEQISKSKNIFSKIRKSNMTSMGIILVVLIFIASIFSPYFLDPYNLQSLVRDIAFIGIIAIAQSCLMLIGELDLSVGKIAAFSGVIGGMLMVNLSLNPYLVLVICLIIGAVLGGINGFLTTKLNLNSIIVTIGMTGVYGGLTLVITQGKAITNIPERIHFLGQGSVLGFPIPFIIMILILVFVIFVVKFTKLGRYIYAIGNNVEAAKILGIKVNTIRVTLFVFVGILCAVAGMLMVARLGSAQPSIGDMWQLNSIAAAVIGGIALTGGLGNPFGAVIGASIITIIQNMIVLFGVSSYWQTAVSGIIVILAISFQSISLMLRERKKRKRNIAA